MEAALNGPLGRTILEPTVLTIGSSPDNQLVLPGSNVAQHQAEIRPEGQGYSITDLGSASGTFVNGQRLDWNIPHLLNSGDSITIGDTTFTYEGDSIPSAHSSPGQPQVGQPQGVAAGRKEKIEISGALLTPEPFQALGEILEVFPPFGVEPSEIRGGRHLTPPGRIPGAGRVEP